MNSRCYFYSKGGEGVIIDKGGGCLHFIKIYTIKTEHVGRPSSGQPVPPEFCFAERYHDCVLS